MPIYNRSRTRRKCSRTAFRRRCGVALSTGFGCEEFLAVLVGISAFRRSFGYGNLQLEVLSMEELDTPNVRLVSECRCRRGVGTLRFRGFGIPSGDCGFLCFRMSFQECSRIIRSGLPAYCRSGDRRRARRILRTGVLELRIGGQIPFLIVRENMKFILCLLAASLACVSCSTKYTEQELIGLWIEPIPGMPGKVQGIALEQGGTAHSINMATLAYESWQCSGDELVLTGESIGNGTKGRFTDTLKIETVSADSLILMRGNLRVGYRRSVEDCGFTAASGEIMRGIVTFAPRSANFPSLWRHDSLLVNRQIRLSERKISAIRCCGMECRCGIGVESCGSDRCRIRSRLRRCIRSHEDYSLIGKR